MLWCCICVVVAAVGLLVLRVVVVSCDIIDAGGYVVACDVVGRRGDSGGVCDDGVIAVVDCSCVAAVSCCMLVLVVLLVLVLLLLLRVVVIVMIDRIGCIVVACAVDWSWYCWSR